MKEKIHIQNLDSDTGIPLSVFSFGTEIGMLVRTVSKRKRDTGGTLGFVWSMDGAHFVVDERLVSLTTLAGTKESVQNCQSFSLAHISQGFVLTYIRTYIPRGKKNLTKNIRILVTAFSKDMYEWKVKTEEETDSESTLFLYDPTVDRYIQYRDGLFLREKSSPRFGHWPKRGSLLATSRAGKFDYGAISLMGAELTDRGILLVYDASVSKDGNTLVQAGALLIDSKHPSHVLWRSEDPVWQGIVESPRQTILPLGIIHRKNVVYLYWQCDADTIIVSTIPALFCEMPTPTKALLERISHNPIIRAHPNRAWEAQGTFNPGAFVDDYGMVHLLYRALGADGVSRVGHARSRDGVHFNYRQVTPIFEPNPGYGMPTVGVGSHSRPQVYNPVMYTSGGGWGGSEDPRVVRIGSTIYMMYVAFEGWASVRIALTSISVDDFLHGRWKWKQPVLISDPKHTNKNWVLFPEKINGKYAILHSIVPHIAVAYLDSLDDFDGKNFITSPRKDGPQPGRKEYWDNVVRGAGPPPVKTKEGWLLLYHASDRRDPGKYKLGAMILDLDDPTKVLYRASQPILSPDEAYENDGKPGVVYASGAVLRGKDLYVYYGGGDKVVCVATAPVSDLLTFIKEGKPDLYSLKKITVE